MITKKTEIWDQAWAAEQPLSKQYAQMERLIYHRNIIGNAANKNLIYGKNGFVRSYFTKSSYKEIQKDGKKLLKPQEIKQTLNFIKKTIKNFWRTARILKIMSEKEKDIHSKKLVRTIKLFDENFIKIFACFLTTWEATSYYSEQHIKKFLKAKFFNSWEDKFLTLLTPFNKDLLLKEKKSWIKILKDPTEKNIKKHMLEYSFLFSNIDSEKEAFAIMKNRVHKENIAKIKQQIIFSEKRLNGIKKSQNEIFALCNPKEIKDSVRLLQQFAILRLELKAAWSGVHYYLYPLYVRISEKTSINIRNIMMFWTIKDIVNFIQNNISVSRAETEQRRFFYFLLFQNKKIKFLSGTKAKNAKDKILQIQSIKNVKEFKGVIASKGNIQGEVLLIKFDDLRRIEKTAQSIKKKKVLVVGMTNPNMVPLIKKAKAIITDEGGITCHAAIISREFGVPCIIGTKIATKVLKDGDLVEVDAERGGVVKILKRAK